MTDLDPLDNLAVEEDVDFVVLMARSHFRVLGVFVVDDRRADATARYDFEVEQIDSRIKPLRDVDRQFRRQVCRSDLDVTGYDQQITMPGKVRYFVGFPVPCIRSACHDTPHS